MDPVFCSSCMAANPLRRKWQHEIENPRFGNRARLMQRVYLLGAKLSEFWSERADAG